MITLTTAAAKAIQHSIDESNAKGLALRLAVKEGQTGGFEYGMGFDEVDDDDILFKSEGIEIIIAPEYGPMLKDTVIDFDHIDSGEQGFLFLNPSDPNYQPPGPKTTDIGGCGSSGCN